MAEVMLPPWVRPESPETIRWIDDATMDFPPAFGRGMTQRGIWADPRWGLRRRYRGLRSDEKAAILNALSETRGQLNILRITPHAPIRGSFQTSELLTNGTFTNGTNGWSESNLGVTLSAADRVLRVRRADGATSTAVRNTQSMAVTANVPYVLRAFAIPGRGTTGAGLRVGTSLGGTEVSESAVSSTGGLLTLVAVPSATPVYASLVDSFSGRMAGDYTSYPYVSYARCTLADNAANLLTRSDEFDHADWAKVGVTIGANSTTAPDGTATMDGLIEDSASSAHMVTQNKTALAAAATDYTIAVEVTPGNRVYCFLQMDEGGSTTVTQYFNLSAGSVASGSTGAGWANRRAAIVDLGDDRYLCVMTARKTTSATTIKAYIGIGESDGVGSYTGNGAGTAIAIRRGGVSTSSVFARIGQTTTAATTGSTQAGSGLYTKGWPASTDGLLLTGDWFEINGELKQLTAPVNSDAAGLAYIQFRPGLAGSPADNDPIIVHEPFGRFIYPQGTRQLENLFGIYGDCEMNLEEIYS